MSVHYYKKNVVLLCLFLVPLIVGCQNTGPKFSAQLTGGKWKLIREGGTLHDVCPGEKLEFLDLYYFTSQCPNSNLIKMKYTFDPETNQLTYVESNAKYLIVTLNNTTLEMGGLGSAGGRYLTYSRTYE